MPTDLWERVKSATSDIVTTASEKTREGIAVASKKLDIGSIKRDIHREFAGLGGRVHQILTADPPGEVPSDVTVLNHLARIRDLEERLETRERELREIRDSGEDEAEDPVVVSTTAATSPPPPVTVRADAPEGAAAADADPVAPRESEGGEGAESADAEPREHN